MVRHFNKIPKRKSSYRILIYKEKYNQIKFQKLPFTPDLTGTSCNMFMNFGVKGIFTKLIKHFFAGHYFLRAFSSINFLEISYH